jgi:acyl carrier protein
LDRQAILEKLTTVMAELFGLDRSTLTPEVRFEDLELTSLDAIDLVIELQAFTGRKVAEARLREVRTIGDMVAVFESQQAPGDSA